MKNFSFVCAAGCYLRAKRYHGDSDFLLKEVDAFLALEDDQTSPEVDHSYYDPEGDVLLLEAFLNNDPLKDLPPHLEYASSKRMYFP
nr:reverse transcriptase domain-containing protein [Tanacetum cinerariifolium]